MKGRVKIVTGMREGRSFLRRSFYTPPYRVADITGRYSRDWLHLMLMSSSPGVLSGDENQISITVGEDSALMLYTQAYQRIFTMEGASGGASQAMDVSLDRGASLCFLPHPVVPHRNSVFNGRNRVHLSAGSRFIWGEVLTGGRGLDGEVFVFSRYGSTTEIFFEEEPIYREHVLLEPAKRPLNGTGQLEGYTHQASLIWKGWDDGEGISRVRELMEGEDGWVFGMTEGAGGVWVLRLLGRGAERLHCCLRAVASKIVNEKLMDHVG